MKAQEASYFSWLDIVRLGVVQTALGAVVVLTTSTLNRVMVVELALAAMLPGALVTAHHAMQMFRPRMGYGSDVGQRRTPWIIGGMAALALGGAGAAFATSVMAYNLPLGVALGFAAYATIGGGVSACGTSLLVLMAKRVAPERRPAAATIVWIMMIAGFAITATVAGKLLDPFSYSRLIAVTGGVSIAAFIVTILAMFRLEGDGGDSTVPDRPDRPAFRQALREVWGEADARRFTIFVFVSMLAYSAQDLILEPFAGVAYGWTPGETTRLSGTQHGGVFLGMVAVAVITTVFKGKPIANLKGWVVGGCLTSGAAMLGLVAASASGGLWPLEANVFVLGVANGVFSIAAIAGMMTLASHGRGEREGTRMGLWGAAQAIAFGAGGFLGTVLVDFFSAVSVPAALTYGFVFALEALGFFVAQYLAAKTAFTKSRQERRDVRLSYGTQAVGQGQVS